MSIKIYEAYRFPLENLNGFLEHVRTNVMTAFIERVKRLLQIGLTVEELDEIDEEILTWDYIKQGGSVENARRSMRIWKLQDKFREASAGSQTSLYDVDASFNLWIKDGYVYAIPYGGYKHGAGDLSFIEDFSYWNNTDPPDNVPDDEFYARGEVWEEICLGDWNVHRLNHTIVDFSSPSPWAAYIMEKALRLDVV